MKFKLTVWPNWIASSKEGETVEILENTTENIAMACQLVGSSDSSKNIICEMLEQEREFNYSSARGKIEQVKDSDDES